MAISIDIIIPSFRLDAQILLRILGLPVPECAAVKFIIIADNPAIKIPPELSEQKDRTDLILIVNEKNLGFSATRNKGINISKSDWILLLDDDIIPDDRLIHEYVSEIKKHENAIGFIGTTHMPKPFNPVTKALDIYGITGHFTSATRSRELTWAPTANLVLNKKKLDGRRFDETLKNGGEDIELLVRNSIENKEKYLAVPEAKVQHPWWDDGKSQLRRMYRYGKGFADIIKYPLIRKYAYRDFTNTAESILLLIMLVFINVLTQSMDYALLLYVGGAVVFSEWLTCVIKTTNVTRKISLITSCQLFIHKIAYEIGALWGIVLSGKLSRVALRVDMGFVKLNPSPFRLNRWKIMKIIIILSALLIFYLIA